MVTTQNSTPGGYSPARNRRRGTAAALITAGVILAVCAQIGLYCGLIPVDGGRYSVEQLHQVCTSSLGIIGVVCRVR